MPTSEKGDGFSSRLRHHAADVAALEGPSAVLLRFHCQRTGDTGVPEDTRVPSGFRNQDSNLDNELQRLVSCLLDDSEIQSVRRESNPRRTE